MTIEQLEKAKDLKSIIEIKEIRLVALSKMLQEHNLTLFNQSKNEIVLIPKELNKTILMLVVAQIEEDLQKAKKEFEEL